MGAPCAHGVPPIARFGDYRSHHTICEAGRSRRQFHMRLLVERGSKYAERPLSSLRINILLADILFKFSVVVVVQQ